MAIDITQIASDITNIINDLPTTATFNSQSVVGFKSVLNRRDILDIEGLREQYVLSIYIKLSSFSSLPDIDDIFVISSIDYRILNKVIDPTGVYCRYDLGEEYSNAV